MIRKLDGSEILLVADLCRRAFGPLADNVAAILPPAFASGQAFGYFDQGALLGARIAFRERDQFRTQILVVDPVRQGDGIALDLSFACRLDAMKRGVFRMVSTIDLENKASAGLVLNRLGQTAHGFDKPHSLEASFRWQLDGERAIAASRGLKIPGEVRSVVAIADDMERSNKLSLLWAAFDSGLELIGLRVEPEVGFYLMG